MPCIEDLKAELAETGNMIAKTELEEPNNRLKFRALYDKSKRLEAEIQRLELAEENGESIPKKRRTKLERLANLK